MSRKRVTLESFVASSKDRVSSDIGGEIAILNMKAGMYYGLDAVGARTWALIQKPKVVREVKNALLDEYRVEPERCEDDLLALLNDLAEKGLIEIKNDVYS